MRKFASHCDPTLYLKLSNRAYWSNHSEEGSSRKISFSAAHKGGVEVDGIPIWDITVEVVEGHIQQDGKDVLGAAFYTESFLLEASLFPKDQLKKMEKEHSLRYGTEVPFPEGPIRIPDSVHVRVWVDTLTFDSIKSVDMESSTLLLIFRLDAKEDETLSRGKYDNEPDVVYWKTTNEKSIIAREVAFKVTQKVDEQSAPEPVPTPRPTTLTADEQQAALDAISARWKKSRDEKIAEVVQIIALIGSVCVASWQLWSQVAGWARTGVWMGNTLSMHSAAPFHPKYLGFQQVIDWIWQQNISAFALCIGLTIAGICSLTIHSEEKKRVPPEEPDWKLTELQKLIRQQEDDNRGLSRGHWYLVGFLVIIFVFWPGSLGYWVGVLILFELRDVRILLRHVNFQRIVRELNYFKPMSDRLSKIEEHLTSGPPGR